VLVGVLLAPVFAPIARPEAGAVLVGALLTPVCTCVCVSVGPTWGLCIIRQYTGYYRDGMPTCTPLLHAHWYSSSALEVPLAR
jgi:hypothetical protein